jgi:hypothetical protein
MCKCDECTGGALDYADGFRRLCDEYGIEPENDDTTMNEDAGLYLDPEDSDYVLDQFVLVSHAGEYAYLKCFATLDLAKREAFYNVDDDIYAEAPSLIVDLDTGERWKPDYAQCPWKLAS